MRLVRAAALDIAIEEHGPPDGPAALLLHGFPDDVRVWDGVAPALAASGWRVVVPWLRGHGATRFRDPATPRSGQQGALAADALALLDALGIGRAFLAGYDWGVRAASAVAALWPERVAGLVCADGYVIQDIAAAKAPAAEIGHELRYWYQWYFHTPRGQAGLAAHRAQIGRLLWRLWSPNWAWDEAAFLRSAASWDNPDYVDVVVHSYMHRYGNVPGDPAYDAIETRLADQPPITVPAVVLCGAADGVSPPDAQDEDRAMFTGPYRRRVVPRAGHFLPREAPEAYVTALTELHDGASPPR